MRRIVSLLAVLFVLALPAAVQAHSDWYNVTIQPSGGAPWVADGLVWFGPGFTNLSSCWQQTTIDPGETERVWNGAQGNNNYMHLGLGAFFNWHIHGLNVTDVVTGADTRNFQFFTYGDEGIGAKSITVGTRRENVSVFGGTFKVVKFVHQAGSYPLVVRANC